MNWLPKYCVVAGRGPKYMYVLEEPASSHDVMHWVVKVNEELVSLQHPIW